MIVAVAYRLTNGLVLSMPAPAFHAELRASLGLLYCRLKRDVAEIGFLDHQGSFMPLFEAFREAERCGQITVSPEGVKMLLWDSGEWPQGDSAVRPESPRGSEPLHRLGRAPR